MAANDSARFKKSNQLLALIAIVQQPPCRQGRSRTHVLPKPIVTKFSFYPYLIFGKHFYGFWNSENFLHLPFFKVAFFLLNCSANVLLHVADVKKLRWHCIGYPCRLIGLTWQPPDREVGVMISAFSCATYPLFEPSRGVESRYAKLLESSLNCVRGSWSLGFILEAMSCFCIGFPYGFWRNFRTVLRVCRGWRHRKVTRWCTKDILSQKTPCRRATKLYPILSLALKNFLRRATKVFLKDIPCFRFNLCKPSYVVSREYDIRLHKYSFGEWNVCSLCFKDLGWCATKHCLITTHRTASDPKRLCACNRSLLRFATKFLSFYCVTWNLSRASYLSRQIW